MKILNYPSSDAERQVDRIIKRGLVYRKKDLTAVGRICENVRKQGDKAVVHYTRKFDSKRVTARSQQVTAKEFTNAVKKVDRNFTRALNRAATNIKSFHELQRRRSWMQAGRPSEFIPAN